MAPEVIMQGRCTSKAYIFSLGTPRSVFERCPVSASASVFVSAPALDQYSGTMTTVVVSCKSMKPSLLKGVTACRDGVLSRR